MQLVAYGAQDVYLTGNPQITFFKVVYRRHTNFSIEAIEQTFNGTASFGKKASVHITRNGDLITNMYLLAQLPEVVYDGTDYERTRFAWIRRVGHAFIDNVEIEIGGSRIDKQYGDWLTIWQELTLPSEQDDGYAKMIGDVPELTELQTPTEDNSVLTPAYRLYVPLQFWFNRNDGLALPLIALQYHEVRVHFEFRDVNELTVHTDNINPRSLVGDVDDALLLVDYIYLDTEERRRFAQVSHEYLIEQLQFTGSEAVSSTSGKYRLNFNHPSKALYWAMKLGQYRSGQKFLAYRAFDWDAAVVDAAKALIVGQYSIDESGQVVDPDDDSAYDDEVMNLVDPKTGLAVENTDGATVKRYNPANTECDPYFQVSGVEDYYYKVCGFARFFEEDGNFFLFDAVVTETTLTIEDLSRPVGRADYDNRNNYARNRDVCVYQWDNYGLNLDGSGNPVIEALLQLNGHDRFDRRDGNYFNYVQPYQHFPNTPADGINVYSFALNPVDHQPSGTANFSRIDNTILQLQFTPTDDFRAAVDDTTEVCIYTVNYNVLRIMSGMGGLAYSN